MKKCTGICGLEKDESEFSFRNDTGKLRGQCKICYANALKKYTNKNKEKITEYMKEYYETNKEIAIQRAAEWAKNNPEKAKASKAKNRKTHAVERAEYNKRFEKEHPEWRKKYEKERKQNDVQYKIACSLRKRLGMAIMSGQKAGSAVDDLGCTIEELVEYFKPLFLLQPPNPETGEMMSWVNYGEWHIDHIKPLVSFDLTDREQFLQACNFTNLQPLWAKDNLQKGAKILTTKEKIKE